MCWVLDNACWHKTQRLEWHHIEKAFLPPYSPDMNPIERFWQHLKGHGMAGCFTGDGDKLCESIRELLDQLELIQSVCALPRL